MATKECIIRSFGRRVKFPDEKHPEKELLGKVVGYDPRPKGKKDGDWFVVRRDDNQDWVPTKEVTFIDDQT